MGAQINYIPSAASELNAISGRSSSMSRPTKKKDKKTFSGKKEQILLQHHLLLRRLAPAMAVTF